MAVSVSAALERRKARAANQNIIPSESIVNDAVEQAMKQTTQQTVKNTAENTIEQVAKGSHHMGKMAAGAATLVGVGLLIRNMNDRKGQQSNQELYGQKKSYS